MVEEVFVDGIGRIAIRGGVVRIELVSWSEVETDSDGKETPKPTVRQRLIMPVDAYGRMFAAMGRTMEQLSKAGVVGTRRDKAGDEPATTTVQ